MVYPLPYSEHSSVEELKQFVQMVCVAHGQEHHVDEMHVLGMGRLNTSAIYCPVAVRTTDALPPPPAFAQVRPGKVIPTVNVGSPEKRALMTGLFQRWLSER